MAAPDLSQIKHEHIRQKAKRKLADSYAKNLIGAVFTTAFLSGLGAVFLGGVIHFIKVANRDPWADVQPSFLSSYMLAFFIVAGVIALALTHTGISTEHEQHEAVAAEFQEDAELTRKEEWERGAPEREAARQRELAAEQEREAKARADAIRAEADRQYDRLMRDHRDALEARSKRTMELAGAIASRFADFALELHLQGITDPETLARRYATERLPLMLSQYGAELGLVREARAQLTPAMQQVVAYLPPAPPALPIPTRPALLTAT